MACSAQKLPFQTIQLTPFQRSANACTGCPNEVAVPTAVQALAAVHETPLRSPVAPGGLGVGVIGQLGPGDPGGHSTTVAAPAVGASDRASRRWTAQRWTRKARRGWASRVRRVVETTAVELLLGVAVDVFNWRHRCMGGSICRAECERWC